MPQSLKIVSSHETPGRLILIVAILVAVAFGWFGIRWQLGSMLAELTSPGDPTAKDVAGIASSLAPRDPLTVWLKANSEKDLVAPEGVDPSVRMFENVVRLAPYDYRWWIELGRVDEQAGRKEQAETAFRRAIELAPSYAYSRWQFGNFLLRANRPDDAFAELRRTTENNLTYREQVFSLAWEYFDKDPSKVESLVADTPDVRASLALFYAARGQAEDSLRTWNKLTDDQKSEHPQIARTIAQALTEKKFFREGLEFSRQVGVDPEARRETVTNGGFEKAIGNPEDNNYGWNVERGDSKLDISTDSSIRHQGDRSLRLTFRTYAKPELSNVWQIIAVDPGASYTLRFWDRTENLRSAGMPLVEVVDAVESHLIAASPAFPTGTNDWQEITVAFRAPESADGVIIRTGRSYCGDACPIVGILWYDDFSINRR